MRKTIEEILLRFVRYYTFNTPIKKGKYRIYQAALGLCREDHISLPVILKDGRRFSANLTTGVQDSVYFVGEYERVLSTITSELIYPGDICMDVGANFGWYTSLFALRCGPAGKVHAFEPVPTSFEELKKTYELMSSPDNVFINNIALGDRDTSVDIYIADKNRTGHASLSTETNVASAVFPCKMTRLDDYIAKKAIERVDFVKVDIEGAELMFLTGAERLFTQASPPILMIEMALATSKSFGYVPNDLITFIRERANYHFYAADEYRGKLKPIDGFAQDDIGANVFCIPEQRSEVTREVLQKYFEN